MVQGGSAAEAMKLRVTDPEAAMTAPGYCGCSVWSAHGQPQVACGACQCVRVGIVR